MELSNDPASETSRQQSESAGQQSDSRTAREEPLRPQPASGTQTIGTNPRQSTNEIRIGKSVAAIQEKGKSVELSIFTMSLGTETIELWPLRNWGQLDVYKWRVQGKLPATPSGLEITNDHVKVAGETVLTNDPQGCPKLERIFNEWLEMEKANLDMARKKLQARQHAPINDPSKTAAATASRFHVQVDKGGQVHIHCFQGKEIVASIGLNLPGFQSLFSQGLMVKPRALKAGVLHDWVELDGVLYSFEKGKDCASELETVLNSKYLPACNAGAGKDILVFPNPASSTGFDIQFPVMIAGVADSRRRPLNEESLEILQDAERSGVLRKGILIRLTRPSLIFKIKTPDGGERYLDRCPENTVVALDDHGKSKVIDLSQPVNCLRLSALELTSIFNHPAIHKHGKAPPSSAPATLQFPLEDEIQAGTPDHASEIEASLPEAITLSPPTAVEDIADEPDEPRPDNVIPLETKELSADPKPNWWLKPVLAQPAIRYDWLVCLIYEKLAERFEDSHEGQFGRSACWAIAIGEEQDVENPNFHGLFLTEKRGFGFINHGRLAHFHKGVLVIGTEVSAIEGIDVDLLAVAIDSQGRIVFIVSDNFRTRFGVAERTVESELTSLKADGAVVLGANEAVESEEPLGVVWTVPVQQECPGEPHAVESLPVAFS